MRDGIPVYKSKDLMDEKLAGTFYDYEIQKVLKSNDVLYRVEKVLRERKRRGQQPEVLIKWEGWPKKFNSWIVKSSLRDI